MDDNRSEKSMAAIREMKEDLDLPRRGSKYEFRADVDEVHAKGVSGSHSDMEGWIRCETNEWTITFDPCPLVHWNLTP